MVASEACCYGRCWHGSACRNDCLCFLVAIMFSVWLLATVEPITAGQAARDYLAQAVTPTLLKGLTELCRQKPQYPVVSMIIDQTLLTNNTASGLFYGFDARHRRRRYYVFRLSIVHLSGQILLPRYLMNGLSNLDETYSE